MRLRYRRSIPAIIGSALWAAALFTSPATSQLYHPPAGQYAPPGGVPGVPEIPAPTKPAVEFAQVRAQPASSNQASLTVLIPGIGTEASDSLMAAGATMSSSHNRYAIELNGAKPKELNIPSDHIINIDVRNAKSVTHAVNQKEVRDAIAKISAEKNATVVVDMQLGLTDVDLRGPGGGRVAWGRETSFAGMFAAKLTETHQQANPTSYNIIFGHSAGTEAVRFAQRVERDRFC